MTQRGKSKFELSQNVFINSKCSFQIANFLSCVSSRSFPGFKGVRSTMQKMGLYSKFPNETLILQAFKQDLVENLNYLNCQQEISLILLGCTHSLSPLANTACRPINICIDGSAI